MCAHFCYKMVLWNICLMHCWICEIASFSPGPHLMWWWTTAFVFRSSETLYAVVCSQHRLPRNGGLSTLEQTRQNVTYGRRNVNWCTFLLNSMVSQGVVAITWWRHQMETFSALLVFCAGNSPVTGEFLAQRPVTRSFDIFFDLRLNKMLSKQSWGWWFETALPPLWRHGNEPQQSEK